MAVVALLIWMARSDGVTTVALVSATSSPPEPFTETVVNVQDQMLIDLASSSTSGEGLVAPHSEVAIDPSLVSGQDDHLYLSTGRPVCDRERLAQLLLEDEGRAVAWSQAAGIAVADIDEILMTWVAVLLGEDTAVTNHTYGSIGARSYQSVLQRGTPVLVDERGVPRVQCSCGNPLLSPRIVGAVEIEGEPWEGFDGGSVVAVEPAPDELSHLVTTDVQTGSLRSVLVGQSDVELLDGYLVVDEDRVFVLGADGQQTTVINEPVFKAVDDGQGGLFFTYSRDDETYRTSDGIYRISPYSVAPDDERKAGIWWLPAGESEPQLLVSSPNPRSEWLQLRGVHELAGVPTLLYESYSLPDSDGVHPVEVGSYVSELMAMNLVDNVTFKPLDHGGSYYYAGAAGEIGKIASGGGRIVFHSSADSYSFFNGYDDHWERLDSSWEPFFNPGNAAGPRDPCMEPDEAPCPYINGLNGEGQLVVLSRHPDAAGEQRYARLAVVDPLTGEIGIDHALEPQLGSSTGRVATLDIEGTQVLVSFPVQFRPLEENPSRPEPDARLVDLLTGEVTDLPVTGEVRFLRAPLERPRADDTQEEDVSSTTTTAPPGPVDDFDDAAFYAACPGSTCEVHASVRLDHARYGPGELRLYGIQGSLDLKAVGYFFHADHLDGGIAWGKVLDQSGTRPGLGYGHPASDSLGHLFVALGTGGPYTLPGVVVPTSTGFEDFGTFAEMPFGGSRAGAWQDLDGDGTFEITIITNEGLGGGCGPTDQWRRDVYKWDGASFAQVEDNTSIPCPWD